MRLPRGKHAMRSNRWMKNNIRKREYSTCVSHGSLSVMGRSRVMEHDISVEPELVPGEYSFFGVYDGKGGGGSTVSGLYRERFHWFLYDEIIRGGEGEIEEWERVMVDCFRRMDEEVVVGYGATVTVTVVGKEVVVAATNCGGGSRVVLCLHGETKIDQPDERKRIENLGAGRGTDRDKNRICTMLTSSTLIGVKYPKPYVISNPEVTVINRTDSDYFLIIATDDLWDVVSTEVACKIVMKCLNGRNVKNGMEKANEAAAKLVGHAIAMGSKDNISVIVVELNKHS